MKEILARACANLLRRLDGPLHFRFIVQPLVAMLFGIHAGLEDARGGEPPFLSAMISYPEVRGIRVKTALRDISSVLIVAAVLDAAYQIMEHSGIFLFELLVTVVLLAVVPYLLMRDLSTRLVRRFLRPQSSAGQHNRAGGL
jgi:predicted ABC-type sugar transport system permease subunit